MPIRILSTGVVEYKTKKGGVTWRTTIAPGDVAEAQRHLKDAELEQVQKAWTDEVVQRWQDDHPPLPERVGPRPLSDKQLLQEALARIEKLEAELAAQKKDQG